MGYVIYCGAYSKIKKRDSKVAVDFPMLKYCPECGGRCRDFAAFYRHCGSKFKDL